ncbi:polysaccharide deacetylase family protein [Streptomyces sp. ZYX-F-203]
MKVIVQNDKKRNSRAWCSRTSGGLALLAATALVAGCVDGSGVRPAPGQQALQAPAARALDGYATRLKEAYTARAAAARRWGLRGVPLVAPPPPEVKPVITTRPGFEVDRHAERGLPPVFTTVPTEERIVFLTIDDGAEKDPEFLRMTSELGIPYTAFLTDYLVEDDYGYFARMRAGGVALDNHTLTHPFLPGLDHAGQKAEICGMQRVLDERFGVRPTVFRPPFGNYDENTLLAAKSCGITHVPLWNEEVFVDRWEYREWDRSIHPGDIVLSHFRGPDQWPGTMADMVRRFLDKVTAEGYAVARLEDYL